VRTSSPKCEVCGGRIVFGVCADCGQIVRRDVGRRVFLGGLAATVAGLLIPTKSFFFFPKNPLVRPNQLVLIEGLFPGDLVEGGWVAKKNGSKRTVAQEEFLQNVRDGCESLYAGVIHEVDKLSLEAPSPDGYARVVVSRIPSEADVASQFLGRGDPRKGNVGKIRINGVENTLFRLPNTTEVIDDRQDNRGRDLASLDGLNGKEIMPWATRKQLSQD
jgi:hypothetical protein